VGGFEFVYASSLSWVCVGIKCLPVCMLVRVELMRECVCVQVQKNKIRALLRCALCACTCKTNILLRVCADERFAKRATNPTENKNRQVCECASAACVSTDTHSAIYRIVSQCACMCRFTIELLEDRVEYDGMHTRVRTFVSVEHECGKQKKNRNLLHFPELSSDVPVG